MATHVLDLTGGLVPDPTAATPPVWQPAAILDANDLYDGLPVLKFVDTTSTKNGAQVAFRVPANYVGTAVFLVRYKANGTSGAVVFDVDYRSIAVGESGDPSSHQRSITATDTIPGTARLLDEVTLTATATDFAAGDTVMLTLSRDCTDAADTTTAAIEVVGFVFQYADA